MRKIVLIASLPLLLDALPYEVRFIGLENRQAIETLLDVSQLIALQHRPPPSINGLRYRVSADIPHLLQALRAYAYYKATITPKIEMHQDTARVDLWIDPGPQFALKNYSVYGGECREIEPAPEMCCPFIPSQFGLTIGSPALSISIINGELNLLTELSRCGYPLAYIDKRRVEVDMKENTVDAASCVHKGPLTAFGPTTIYGIEHINPHMIRNKISWKEGEIYDSDLVRETQNRLLKTELFSSVMISHEERLDDQGELPLKMRVTEAKHKKIALGVFYATVNGFGGNATWTNRNFRNIGEVVSTKIEFAQKSYEGLLTYKKTDFLQFDQNYRALLELSHEKIYPYHSLLMRFANFIERPLRSSGYLSIGLKVDHINVSNSATNGTYFLIGTPLFLKYDRSDNPLDPRQGFTAAYSATPYQSLQEGSTHFVKQRLTTTLYLPLLPSNWCILALRTQFGSIAGASTHKIPLPKLFLGGSEDDLRGYKYQTVSPLKGTKPLGGRSAFFSSAELRIRIDKIGIVPFADFGTVSKKELPSFDAKWYKSIGIGLRYFAFFGPLRFDIGFPLDKRKHIDNNYQIYASVGQSF